MPGVKQACRAQWKYTRRHMQSRVFTVSHTFSHSPRHPSNVSWKTGCKGPVCLCISWGLCVARLKGRGVHGWDTVVGFTGSYNGAAAEDTEALESPGAARLLPCDTGDSAPKPDTSSPLQPTHPTWAQGRWPGGFMWNHGTRKDPLQTSHL